MQETLAEMTHLESNRHVAGVRREQSLEEARRRGRRPSCVKVVDQAGQSPSTKWVIAAL
jgi:hypothetical protein